MGKTRRPPNGPRAKMMPISVGCPPSERMNKGVKGKAMLRLNMPNAPEIERTRMLPRMKPKVLEAGGI